MLAIILRTLVALSLSGTAQAVVDADSVNPAPPQCASHKFSKAKTITHYMIPLLDEYDHFQCDKLEGTCIYNKDGEAYLHNFGYADEPLSQARCKNGYGNMKNCLHPCRVVAASMEHHKFGEVLFIKDLVGKKCGNLERDGFEIIHDGYVVVYDTGSPVHFHSTGRFDFFWGRCKDSKNGVCNEGAEQVTQAISHGDYCVVWDPKNPRANSKYKTDFAQKVRAEAVARGDIEAAAEFNLDHLGNDAQ
jgi:hypothetical protein